MSSQSHGKKFGIVGATGVVGLSFLKQLELKKMPFADLKLFASEDSKGKKLTCQGREFTVETLKPGCFRGLDIVFFSSGDDISKEWAPKAVEDGAWAIDNSAAFRMNPENHLVVPEVNGHLIKKGDRPQVIANPNCSTIQLVVALKPLADKFGLEDVKVSSYQSVSGGGLPAMNEMLGQMRAWSQKSDSDENIEWARNQKADKFLLNKPILFNVVPHIGSFNDEGFSSEEVKVMNETRKILGLKDLKVSAFTVRVPSLIGHSESVWVRLQKKVSRDEVLSALKNFPGLVISDSLKGADYPTPLMSAHTDPVYVGRIHQDPNDPQTWMMWVVADNVLKGAALNGIQIAQLLM